MCWDGGWTRKALYLWGIILGSCCCCCTAQHANYIFVLDAGSSGTRGYAFSYRMSQSSPFLPKFIPIPPSAAARQIPRKLGVGMYDRVETLPGMGALLSQPADIREKALQPLIEWGKAGIPRSAQSCTPIFLLATGGARSLSQESRDQMLQAAREVLADSPFMSQPDWTRIISGSLEGAYSYVALAYTRGLLHKLQGGGREAQASVISARSVVKNGSGSLLQPQQFSLGILDLGGSSFEVTSNQVYRDQQTLRARQTTPVAVPINLTVGDATLQLSATTYKHCGLMDTWDRSVSLLLQGVADGHGAESLPLVKSPCLHQGFSAPYSRAMPRNIAPRVKAVQLVGDPDERRCAMLVHALVKPCAAWPQGTPLQGEYVGISGFYVVSEFLRLAIPNTVSDPSYVSMHTHANEFLRMPWEEVKASLGQHVNVEKYALWGMYAPALLGPYGFNLSTDRVVIGTKDMSWPLGAAIIEVSEQLAQSFHRTGTQELWTCGVKLDSRAAVISGVLIMALFVLAMIYISYAVLDYLKQHSWRLLEH